MVQLNGCAVIYHHRSKVRKLYGRSVYSYGTAIVTGFMEHTAVQTLSASPNPVAQVMALNFQAVPTGAYQLSITNRLGHEIQRETLQVNE